MKLKHLQYKKSKILVPRNRKNIMKGIVCETYTSDLTKLS